MKTVFMVLALTIPLMAQEVESKEEIEKETVPQKVVRHLQDTEWRKFQAAHGRAHSKRGEQYSNRESRGDKRKEMSKKHKIRQVVRLVVVGGLAYYIGYHQGEEHFKGGMKRRPYMGDRK
tara:strand:- start:149 stop:508 length:360 start_codon:yes stop_codon:yes gene_type:complete